MQATMVNQHDIIGKIFNLKVNEITTANLKTSKYLFAWEWTSLYLNDGSFKYVLIWVVLS